MKVIIVTGVPGTGKTLLSRKLARKLDFYYLDVNRLISKHNLAENYDRKRRAKIIDPEKLNKFLIKEINFMKSFADKNIKGMVIDSHLSHCLPAKYADVCIVARCGIGELNRRLRKKGFNKNKIRENLQAEIFNICYEEALRKKHRVIALDTTRGFNISKISRLIK